MSFKLRGEYVMAAWHLRNCTDGTYKNGVDYNNYCRKSGVKWKMLREGIYI